MAQIAAIAGVSRSTVSRALASDRRLPAETCEKIQKIARDLGYRMNPALASTMAGVRLGRVARVGANLAWLEDVATDQEMKQSATNLTARLWDGVYFRALELGYGLEVLKIREFGMDGTRLSQIMETRGIQGVVLGPSPYPGQRPHLEWDRFTYAALGDTLDTPKLHRVSLDHFGTVFLVLDHLRKLDYRRIGLVFDPVQNEKCRYQPWAAFIHYQLLHPEIGSIPILGQASAASMRAWIDQHRPDAVVAASSAVLYLLVECGISIPDEMGFAMLERPSYDITCAGADEHGVTVGAATVDLIMAGLHSNDFGIPHHAKTILIESTWMDGPTLRRTGGEESVFARAADAGPEHFCCLELDRFCNREVTSCESPFFGGDFALPLNNVPAGRSVFHGVPFQIAGGEGSVAIMLRSQTINSSRGKLLPLGVRIPVRQRAALLYFLHGCGWAHTHTAIGYYVLHYEDGTFDKQEVVPLSISLSNRASAEKLRRKESTLQDWSPAFEHFETESTKPVPFVLGPRVWDRRAHFYVWQWVNPSPDKVIWEIGLEAIADQESPLAVLGITLLQR